MQEDDQYVPQRTYANNKRPSTNPHESCLIMFFIHYAPNHPEYRKEKEDNKINELIKPLLLFPVQLIEDFSYIYQVLSPCVQSHIVV